MRRCIRELLTQTQLVQVEVDLPEMEDENPWIKNSGLFRDDPTWDDFLEEMATYRQQENIIEVAEGIKY